MAKNGRAAGSSAAQVKVLPSANTNPTRGDLEDVAGSQLLLEAPAR